MNMTAIDLLIAVQNETRAKMCCYDRAATKMCLYEWKARRAYGFESVVKYLMDKIRKEVAAGRELTIVDPNDPELQLYLAIRELLGDVGEQVQGLDFANAKFVHPEPTTEQ